MTGFLVEANAREMMSLRAWCLVIRLGAILHTKAWRPHPPVTHTDRYVQRRDPDRAVLLLLLLLCASVTVLDFRSTGREFDSRRRAVGCNSGQVVCTCASVTKQYNWYQPLGDVLRLGR